MKISNILAAFAGCLAFSNAQVFVAIAATEIGALAIEDLVITMEATDVVATVTKVVFQWGGHVIELLGDAAQAVTEAAAFGLEQLPNGGFAQAASVILRPGEAIRAAGFGQLKVQGVAVVRSTISLQTGADGLLEAAGTATGGFELADGLSSSFGPYSAVFRADA